jgi:hypothetical protein
MMLRSCAKPENVEADEGGVTQVFRQARSQVRESRGEGENKPRLDAAFRVKNRIPGAGFIVCGKKLSDYQAPASAPFRDIFAPRRTKGGG